METKETKQNQGITLIALVVTIVVLLILAGISIDMVIGKGGIIAKAKDAQEESRGASVEDARDLWRSDVIIAQESDSGESQSLDELLEDLRVKGLLTDSEVFQIKSTGEVKIGSHNINFSLDGSSTKVDWSKLEPGLYETGTDTLIKSWDDLVADYEVGQYSISQFNLKEKGDLVISRSVQRIYDGSNGCGTFTSNLTGVFIPKEAKIEEYACVRNRALKRVVIEEGITSIGEGAFSSNESLEEIIIPESVNEIGQYALNSTLWYSKKNDGFIYVGKILYCYKGTIPTNTIIEIKDGTKGITGGAFVTGKKNIVKVVIPDSVKTIGDSVFYDCTNLSDIEGGNGITELGQQVVDGTAWYNNQSDGVIYLGSALYGYKGTMPSGTEITVKDGTGTITSEAFKDCTGLTKITLPNTVETIGEYAFSNTGLTSIELGNSLRKIGRDAFNSTNIEKIELPDTVEEIGLYTFANCTNLASIKLSNRLTMIPRFSFINCTKLKKITIPDSVVEFEFFQGKCEAFDGCTGVESVTIPKGIRYFPGGTLSAFTNLKTVNFRGTEEEWKSIIEKSYEENPVDTTKVTVVYNYTGE